jgi:hypothetical protein
MVSDFLIQIINRRTGEVVQWAPGLQVETDFINDLGGRVAAKSVGVGRTRKQVAERVKEAVQELLLDLKRQV